MFDKGNFPLKPPPLLRAAKIAKNKLEIMTKKRERIWEEAGVLVSNFFGIYAI